MRLVNFNLSQHQLCLLACNVLDEIVPGLLVDHDSLVVVRTGKSLVHPETFEDCHGVTIPPALILVANQPLKLLVSTFVHELVHYAQFAGGRLTDDYFLPLEGGEIMNPYNRKIQPHEVEAERIEENVMEGWKYWSKNP